MPSVRMFCNRSDSICPYLFIFGAFFLLVALLIKFSYDSSRVQPLLRTTTVANPSGRVFEVVINMPGDDDCPSYENLFGSPGSSALPSPMRRISVSSADNCLTGQSTPARCHTPSPPPSPGPWLVVPDFERGFQTPPPTYHEAMNLTVPQHL